MDNFIWNAYHHLRGPYQLHNIISWDVRTSFWRQPGSVWKPPPSLPNGIARIVKNGSFHLKIWRDEDVTRTGVMLTQHVQSKPAICLRSAQKATRVVKINFLRGLLLTTRARDLCALARNITQNTVVAMGTYGTLSKYLGPIRNETTLAVSMFRTSSYSIYLSSTIKYVHLTKGLHSNNYFTCVRNALCKVIRYT